MKRYWVGKLSRWDRRWTVFDSRRGTMVSHHGRLEDAEAACAREEAGQLSDDKVDPERGRLYLEARFAKPRKPLQR